MRTRLFLITGAAVLLLAVAFLIATKYAFDPAHHNYRLEFTGFETNRGIVEASFKLETGSRLPIERLGFTLQREIVITNRWRTDEAWSVVPRVAPSAREIRFHVPVPDDQHRWRLAADLAVKPYFFDANHIRISTDPIETIPNRMNARPGDSE